MFLFAGNNLYLWCNCILFYIISVFTHIVIKQHTLKYILIDVYGKMFSSSIQLKQEEFKDTKGVIRMRKSKDGQKKKDKETNNDL